MLKSSASFDLKTYLAVCEAKGVEPNPDRMPLELSSFPLDVQVAFFVYEKLPDKISDSTGLYLGKDWNCFNSIIDLYSYREQKQVIFEIAHLYDSVVVEYRAKEFAEKVEREKKKASQASGTGKKYAFNVNG